MLGEQGCDSARSELHRFLDGEIHAFAARDAEADVSCKRGFDFSVSPVADFHENLIASHIPDPSRIFAPVAVEYGQVRASFEAKYRAKIVGAFFVQPKDGAFFKGLRKIKPGDAHI
jgi:hypothetical protein